MSAFNNKGELLSNESPQEVFRPLPKQAHHVREEGGQRSPGSGNQWNSPGNRGGRGEKSLDELECQLFLDAKKTVRMQWECRTREDEQEIRFKLSIANMDPDFELGFGFANGSTLAYADLILLHFDGHRLTHKVC